MRKSDLSKEQLSIRDGIMEKLIQAGWSDQFTEGWFDNNNWFESEISMSYDSPYLKMELEYLFEDYSVNLLLSVSDNKEIAFVVYPEDHLKEFIDFLVDNQNLILDKGIQNFTSNLLEICPNIYVDPGNGDKLIPLIENSR